ncbi:MAG TPA: hypothetical protein VNA14_04710, partial [Mycobacteriales bacterium]|nr:hypothetical protein [Mycobacteriales bacterium]
MRRGGLPALRHDDGDLREGRLRRRPRRGARDVTSVPVASSDEAAMHLALTEARAALEHDDVPVGAVVVSAAGEAVAVGHNERELTADPTA